jgi:hypothetical protein
LVAQVVVAISLLAVLSSVIALYLDVFFGLGLAPWQLWFALAIAGSVGVCLSIWSMQRPNPVLVVNREGLDWRLPGSAADQVGWDRIEAYALHDAGELARTGIVAPPEKTGERFIAVHLRAGGGPQVLVAFEMDIAPGLDEAIEAMRRQRPDLERTL